jgi:uncharacterized protein YneF (UPF0154 family)
MSEKTFEEKVKVVAQDIFQHKKDNPSFKTKSVEEVIETIKKEFSKEKVEELYNSIKK